MNNPFHDDWLRRFREDLRTGNTDSLSANVEMAGLDVILDTEFCEQVCHEDARQVAILIGSLGESNSNDKVTYSRLRASYQYLTGQVDLASAATECAMHDRRVLDFYLNILEATKEQKEIDASKNFARVEDIQFAIELQINTGNSTAFFSLLKKWQAIDKSDLPWLRACRCVVRRGEKVILTTEALKLSLCAEKLIAIAPKNQQQVIQEMRVQWSCFAYKGKDGKAAIKAAKQAYDYDQNEERRFSLAKALILDGQTEHAIEHLRTLLIKTISASSLEKAETKKIESKTFNVLAAENALIDINKHLKNKGLKPFLMSGTLLGYAREKALLKHDKDVDLGVIGWENQFAVAEALLEAGYYKLDLSQLTGKNRFLMSAHDLKNGMAIDIFLFHEKNDHFLHGIDFDMNFTQNFRFSKFTLKEVDFLNQIFYAPSDIDVNLTENYGNWMTPAPSYIVTVESPALCDTKESRNILIYMEILKTIVKNMNPQRISRILDHLESSHNDVLGAEIHENLRNWCHQKQINLSSSR